jgi:hypothetical protein
MKSSLGSKATGYFDDNNDDYVYTPEVDNNDDNHDYLWADLLQ